MEPKAVIFAVILMACAALCVILAEPGEPGEPSDDDIFLPNANKNYRHWAKFVRRWRYVWRRLMRSKLDSHNWMYHQVLNVMMSGVKYLGFFVIWRK